MIFVEGLCGVLVRRPIELGIRTSPSLRIRSILPFIPGLGLSPRAVSPTHSVASAVTSLTEGLGTTIRSALKIPLNAWCYPASTNAGRLGERLYEHRIRSESFPKCLPLAGVCERDGGGWVRGGTCAGVVGLRETLREIKRNPRARTPCVSLGDIDSVESVLSCRCSPHIIEAVLNMWVIRVCEEVLLMGS